MTEEAARCSFCNTEQHRLTRSIIHRVGHEPSFAELWKRLERAEADRDRMMNALQLVRDEKHKGRIAMPPRIMTLVNRALSRIAPTRLASTDSPAQQTDEGIVA